MKRNGRTERLALLVLCGAASPAAALLVHDPHLLQSHPISATAIGRVRSLHRPPPRAGVSRLDTKRDGNVEGDFASFDDFGQGEGGQELARQFYDELEYRQSMGELSTSPGEPAGFDDADDRDDKKTRGTIRASVGILKNNDSGNGASSSQSNSNSSSKGWPFAAKSQSTNESKRPATPAFDFDIFDLFSFAAPPPRPSPSAGLFSGSGATVYSPGRSIRAEIEILETQIKNSEARESNSSGKRFRWEPSEEQEELIRSIISLAILLSVAYVAVESAGGVEALSMDGASASADHVVGLLNDVAKDLVATKEEISSIMLSVGQGDVLLGEEAAWLMKESAEIAKTVSEAVRMVEEIVLI